MQDLRQMPMIERAAKNHNIKTVRISQKGKIGIIANVCGLGLASMDFINQLRSEESISCLTDTTSFIFRD